MLSVKLLDISMHAVSPGCSMQQDQSGRSGNFSAGLSSFDCPAYLHAHFHEAVTCTPGISVRLLAHVRLERTHTCTAALALATSWGT